MLIGSHPPRVTPYSKHLELNEEGTAVAVDRRFVPYLFYPAWCLLTLQTMTDFDLIALGSPSISSIWLSDNLATPVHVLWVLQE